MDMDIGTDIHIIIFILRGSVKQSVLFFVKIFTYYHCTFPFNKEIKHF